MNPPRINRLNVDVFADSYAGTTFIPLSMITSFNFGVLAVKMDNLLYVLISDS